VPNQRIFIYLTPLIPLSFKGEGEEILERGEAPLLPKLPLPLIREGGQGDRLLNDLWLMSLDMTKIAAIVLNIG